MRQLISQRLGLRLLQLALQHQPKQRFTDAAEFRDALRRPMRSSKPAIDNDIRQLRIWKGISIVLGVLLLISITMRGN